MTSQTIDRLGEARLNLGPAAEGSAHRYLRSLTGVTVEIAHLHGPSSDPEDLRSTLPRLTVILEQIGGHAEMGLTPHRLAPLPVAGYRAASHLTFVPADTPLWQLAQRFRYIRRLVIDFDLSVLAATFGDALTLASCVEPRLMFRDSGILALAELLADACLGSGTDCRLYGDSLALAMSYKLFGADRARRNRGGLAPSQLRRVIALLEQSLPNAVALKDLAELTGLSEAYFSRAFKASTGMPPQRWRVAAKVQRAQTLLVETGDSLAAIALACGFADQSHFSRAFQTIAGASPGAWRKRHCV